jgi:RNA polymerase sigma-70 factor (ECF subfamily)
MAGYALPAEVEEQQVLRSCLNGHKDGLDLLYRRYAPALVAFCNHRLGNLGDAEDAAHETILKAHRALPRFREGARLWPWLATIAANVCTDIQRSRERFGPEEDAIDCLGPEVDETVSARLRASIVDTALDELPERFRTPLFLREFMGWSYEEIAGFSNKSIGSVRTTLMRARRAFQTRVEDVARRRGQWPLPVAVGGLGGAWRRMRAAVRSWRDSLARSGGDLAGVVARAEGMFMAFAPGLQAALVGVTAAGALMIAPAAAATGTLLGQQGAPTPPAEISGPALAAHPASPSGSAHPVGTPVSTTTTIVGVAKNTDGIAPTPARGSGATWVGPDSRGHTDAFSKTDVWVAGYHAYSNNAADICNPNAEDLGPAMCEVSNAVAKIVGPSH